MSRAAMQQALEALEHEARTGNDDAYRAERDALRAALAEPEQEPVAWAVYDILHGGSKSLHWPEQHSPNGDPKQYKAVPLYTAPTPRRPLTDDALHQVIRAGNYDSMEQFARAVEAAHGIGEQHD